MADFPFFKMAAVRHLGLLKVGNFNFRSRSEAQYASSCQILRISIELFRRYGRFSIFQDGGRPPSWICFRVLGHTRRVFGGLCDCANVGCNRCSNFDSMQIFNILHVKLENAYSRPHNRGFGEFYPQNGEQYERDPKRYIIGRKHVVWRIDRQNRSTCAGSERAEEKSKKGIPKKPHVFIPTTHVVAAPRGFACLGIPATWLYIPSFIEIR